MSSVESVDWLASMQLDPEEADRADVRHALMMDLLVRMLYRGKQRTLPGVSEFLAGLPWRAEHVPARPQTQDELQSKINAVMRTLGGKPVVR